MADGIESQASGGTGRLTSDDKPALQNIPIRLFDITPEQASMMNRMRSTPGRRLTRVLARFRGRELGSFPSVETAREAYNKAEREWEWAEEKKIDAMMHL